MILFPKMVDRYFRHGHDNPNKRNDCQYIQHGLSECITEQHSNNNIEQATNQPKKQLSKHKGLFSNEIGQIFLGT